MIKPVTPRRILIVDDDPDFQNVMRTRLEAAGYAVSTAANGKEALSVFETSTSPHLVMLDIDMPEQDGLSALINLETRLSLPVEGKKNRIPVLVVTGMDNDEIKKIALRHHVKSYLRKPVDTKELLKKIEDLIGTNG